MTRARLAAAAVVTLILGPVGRASLYQADEPAFGAVPVRDDGTGDALPFEEFKRRLAVLRNVANQQKPTDDRRKVIDRAAARARRPDLPPGEAVALAVDVLRLGEVAPPPVRLDPSDALNRLTALARERGRRPDYYVLSTLAHLYAARGEWAAALDNLTAALTDAEAPPPVKGLTPAQQVWQTRLDRDYVRHLFRLNREAAAASPKPDPTAESPYPLFPVPKRGAPADPLRFVDDAGGYTPGKLAAAERAKLPADAVAVVQQLLLWFPGDTRLYWLLGELYAADGDLVAAKTVFDECVDVLQYGNRKLVVDHRAAVRAAIPTPPPPPPPSVNWQMIGVYFAAVGAVVLFAVVRAVRRRCGPAGCR